MTATRSSTGRPPATASGSPTPTWLEVDEDRCAGGDEAVFGGGKTIRDAPAGAMQAHGPATLWRSLGRAVAGDQAKAALGARWRRLVLADARASPAAAEEAASGTPALLMRS